MTKKTKDKSDKYYRTCYLTNWEREGYCKEAIEFAKAHPNLTNAKVKKLVIKAKTLDEDSPNKPILDIKKPNFKEDKSKNIPSKNEDKEEWTSF